MLPETHSFQEWCVKQHGQNNVDKVMVHVYYTSTLRLFYFEYAHPWQSYGLEENLICKTARANYFINDGSRVKVLVHNTRSDSGEHLCFCYFKFLYSWQS